MFCTYCQKKRPENESPCPNCGAASPLQKPLTLGNWGTQDANAGSWSNAGSLSWGGQAQEAQWGQAPQASFGAAQASNAWASFAPAPPDKDPWQAPSRASFADPVLPDKDPWQPNNDPWQAPSNMSFAAPEAPSQWGQTARASLQADLQPEQQSLAGYSNWGAQEQASPEGAGQSMLPVPYQGGQNGLQVNSSQMMNLPVLAQAPTTLAELAPALPESSVYVPPTFTKPRPLIPRYRIISGMLSLLIVTLAACGGLTYLAKTNSTVNTIVRTFTGAPPPPVTLSSAKLPNPPTQPVDGPAANQIQVATTASSIDPKSNTPLQSTQSFMTNQIIYLTFSINNPTNGTVTAKWYMNNDFYQERSLAIKQGNEPINGRMSMAYATPSEGYVELYWNNQMAKRLFFVVRSS